LIVPRESDGEILSLTSIRGVAALWVVLFHLSSIQRGLLPEASFLDPLISSGHLAVPLFFILSGYVLSLRYLGTFRSVRPKGVIRFLWLRLGGGMSQEKWTRG
jgi:peptidoglycan/LPS O-acetylase OafA/YrhL